jgi:hypothetical protein
MANENNPNQDDAKKVTIFVNRFAVLVSIRGTKKICCRSRCMGRMLALKMR